MPLALLAASACGTATGQSDSIAIAERSVSAEHRVGADSLVERFSLLTDSRAFDIRSGESIVIPVSLATDSAYTGPLRPEMDVSRLPAGISVSGVPDLLDAMGDSSPAFYVAFAVDISVPVGTTGDVTIEFSDPVDPLHRGDTSALIAVNVVSQGSNIGPVTGVDLVTSTVGGTTFSPVVTDVAGDAALDPASLEVVSEPAQGSLTLHSDGTFAYMPSTAGPDAATYRVCDANGACEIGEIRFWTS